MTTTIPFLTDAFLRQANEILKLPSDITAAFEQAIRLIRSSDTLRAMAVESRGKLYRSWESNELAVDIWPADDVLAEQMGGQAGMFAAIVLLSGLPETIERYRSRGIPRRILEDTMTDLQIWMRDYRRRHNVWGFDNADWLRLHMTARIFRLGRLQFEIGASPYKIHVFRRVHGGEAVVFSADGVRYNRRGLTDGNNGEVDEHGGWESAFREADGEIAGNVIAPEGFATRESVKLRAGEWRQVLAENDPVLHVHIPEDGRMAHDLCRESYRLALGFFPVYFPEFDFKAFVCGSWLLSPQFRQLLPASSNIVRFLGDYRIFPIRSMQEWTLTRVFGKRDIDPASAPRDTSLRRAVLDHIAEGNRMISAGGFILRDEAAKEYLT